MKKIIALFLLNIFLIVFAPQSKAQFNLTYTVYTKASLYGSDTYSNGDIVFVMGQDTWNDIYVEKWMWDGTSTQTSNDSLIIRPNLVESIYPGRWVKLKEGTDWNQVHPSRSDYIANKPALTNGTVTSIGLSSTDFSVSGTPVTASGNITANLNTSGVTAGTYNGNYTVDNKGRLTAANNLSFNNSPSVTIQTATIAGSATGYVVLEICATNSATAGDWTEIGRAPNGQSVSLAITLQSVSTGGGQLGGIVPAGYYRRLRSVNSNGTPTYTYNSGQEVLL